jgi:hypothetical protein
MKMPSLEQALIYEIICAKSVIEAILEKRHLIPSEIWDDTCIIFNLNRAYESLLVCVERIKKIAS